MTKYYSAKKKKRLTLTTWINLKIIMLGERATQKSVVYTV